MSGARVRVLTYHRVMDLAGAPPCNPSLVSASPAVFEAQMRHLARRYRVVSVEEALAALRGGRPLPRRATLVTFDDAYRDFGEVAWPILRRYRLPATVFVPTAYPDHPELCFWWDRLYVAFKSTRRKLLQTPCGPLRLDTTAARRQSLRELQWQLKLIPHAQAMPLIDRLCRELGADTPPKGDVLTWKQLRELAADGVTCAAHTRTHPALTQLPIARMREEIRGAQQDLARELGRVLPIFAYPFGAHDDRVVAVVRDEGFELAVTSIDGHSRIPGSNPLRLCRTNVTRRTTPLIFRLRLMLWAPYADRWRHARPRRPRPSTEQAAVSRADVPGAPGLKLAFIMSRFPKLSETFILNEIRTAASLGVPVEVYPLLRERQRTTHPEVEEWVRRAHFHPFVSLRVLQANASFLWQQPATYFRLWAEVLRKTWRSTNFFVGAIGIFPKAVRFAYEMRAQGVNHVHAQFATHPAVAALIIHRLTGIPFSFTAHGSDLHVDRTMLGAKVEAAAFAVTVSGFNREVMVRECGEHARSKIHVIHCGVDGDVFAPASQPPEGPFQIVCIASFEEVKGHTYLIDACALLRDRGIDFRCHLVGDGPRRRQIQAQVAHLGLADRVRFHGAQPRPEVTKLLGASHVAVLASHPTRSGKREGIPVSLMEAMAAGLPVVATSISGIPELVDAGVSGLLVPSGNAELIAEALSRLDNDRELCARLGRAGRNKVMSAFNLRRNTLQLLALCAGAATLQPHETPAARPAAVTG